MTGLSGSCDPKFRPVADAYQSLFEHRPGSGPPDLGSAVAVMVDEELVVDLWGGYADAARTKPWGRDTIVGVASTSKGITALCAHMLADRGRFDYDEPVATYWPEFAAAGKASVTVRQVMSHQAGLAQIGGLESGFFEDWEGAVEALAAGAPEYEPGSSHGYHTVSFGHLVGEIIRRIDGRDVGAFIREEINRPLGVDLFIGLKPDEDARCAEKALVLLPNEPDDSFMVQVMTPMIDAGNRRSWRAAQIPAANCHTDARSLATVYGALADGGVVKGVQLLHQETIAAATEVQVHGLDLTRSLATEGLVSEYGLGWLLSGDDEAPMRTPGCFGHGGMFGSWGWASPAEGIGFGYVMNDCYPGEHYGSGDLRGEYLLASLLEVLS